jgi:hypothetical protein
MLQQFDLDSNQPTVTLDHTVCTAHPIGRSWLSPDNRYCYVNIPKIGSSTMKSLLQDWQPADYHTVPDNVEFLVLLRDPTRRWISAVSEFLAGAHGIPGADQRSQSSIDDLIRNPIVKNWIFHSVYLDGHSLPQCYYLQHLPWDRTKFFNYDHNGIQQLVDHVGIDRPVGHLNKGDSLLKKHVVNWINKQLGSYPELQKIIDIHYWCDHQLLDKAFADSYN